MERAVPILPTGDLAAAKAFYVDGLGFRVTFEASRDGRSGLLGLERGTIQLTLDSPMAGHGRDACVSLLVDDTDEYYREWSPSVTVLRAPRDEEWGARTFDLLDPSGNTIFVNGSSQREEAGDLIRGCESLELPRREPNSRLPAKCRAKSPTSERSAMR